MDNSGIGAAVRVWRDREGWSQQRLADELGVHKTAVSRWEVGKTLPPIETRRKLAEIMGLSHVDLLVAAGELTQEEAVSAGAPITPTDPASKVVREIDRYDWDEDDATRAIAIMRALMAGRERG